MYPSQVAAEQPERLAVAIAESGDSITYTQLAERANQVAQLFRAHGLHSGDHAALMAENCIEYVEVIWAAHIAGIVLTPINNKLTPGEASYLVNDCGARCLLMSEAVSDV